MAFSSVTCLIFVSAPFLIAHDDGWGAPTGALTWVCFGLATLSLVCGWAYVFPRSSSLLLNLLNMAMSVLGAALVVLMLASAIWLITVTV